MLFDISPPLHSGLPVWPGDTPLVSELAWQLSADCPVNVARLTLSGHSGAHADAPGHFLSQGKGIGEVDLLPYLGPCRVVHCLRPGELISLSQLQEALQRQAGPLPPRLLIRSYQRFPLEVWDADFPGLDPLAIHWLAEQEVLLIGVDTASLDAMNSKTLDAHHAAANREMAILEQLWLDEVAEGDYELIALPLRLVELDASPVRAVLRR
ncbi:arylformamidase [Neisseriaceae bacterium TC5R-5]|nr:arylformamidase [Neisseriaceae bacterium TC5R-5]